MYFLIGCVKQYSDMSLLVCRNQPSPDWLVFRQIGEINHFKLHLCSEIASDKLQKINCHWWSISNDENHDSLVFLIYRNFCLSHESFVNVSSSNFSLQINGFEECGRSEVWGSNNIYRWLMSCHRTHNKSAKPLVRFCTSLLIVSMMMMQNGDAEYVDGFWGIKVNRIKNAISDGWM